MDVAIQAKLEATQALADANELFRTLEAARLSAANLKIGGSSGASQSFEQVASSAKNAAQEIISMASATARQQVATGQLTAAILTLEKALNTEGASTVSLINLETQLIKVKQQLAVQNSAGMAQTQQQTGLATQLLGGLLRMAAAYLTINEAIKLFNEAIAGRIEMDRLVIGMRALTDNSEQAAQATGFLISESQRLGLNLQSTIPEFVKMTAALTSSGLSFAQAEQAFTNISIASKALGLSSAATGRILFDLQEMASIGTVQMRQLRQMIMQMPGALQAFAQAANMTTEQFMNAVHKGLIDPAMIATTGLATLAAKYEHEMPEAMDTLESHVNRLKNSWMLLMAEMGKSDAIKSGSDFLTTAATRAQALLEARSKGIDTGAGGDNRLNKLSMSLEFPNAAPAGTAPGDFDSVKKFSFSKMGIVDDKVPDMLSAYIRMRSEQQKFNDEQQKADDAHAQSLAGEKPLTEAQEQAFQKIEDIKNRTDVEALTGLQKQLAQIQVNAQKQMEEIDKAAAAAGTSAAANDAAAKARLAVLVNADKQSQLLLDADARKRADEQSKEIVGQFDSLKQITDKLQLDIIPDDQVKRIAEVNKQFDDLYAKVLEIDLATTLKVPESTYNDIETARQNALKALKDKRTKTDFAGQDFGTLSSQRDSLKQSLLTETDEHEFQKTATRIQEISDEMARQLKTDAAGIGNAFVFGFKETTDAFGSFSERMTTVGASLATSFSNNMSSAFSSIILGTKSAQEAFSDMARQIVDDLVQVVVQELIVKQILSFFGGGGIGGGGGNIAGAPGTVGHRGAVAGAGVSLMNLSSAPRFHAGSGLVGDEMALVARRGEVMFTPEQMKELGKVMAGNQTQNNRKVEIANYFDPKMVDERIAANPHIVVNAVTQQRKQVKRVLA